MAKSVYLKDLVQSFSKSKGRFFSIFSLMMIGSIALVGLKVTTPNMQRTAQSYINKTNMMDLTVMADYGLSDADVAELKTIKDATVDFGYLSDQVIEGTNDAVRVFSETDTVSQYDLVSGKLPSKADEIALVASMSNSYKVGDTITFKIDKESKKSVLKTKTFRVTGFVHSAEIWDNSSMGQTKVGTGELTGYGVTVPESFDSDSYMIARISYDDLDELSFADAAYEEKLAEHQETLDKMLADNGSARLTVLKADAQKEIDEGKAKIADSEKKLADADQQIQDGERQIADGQNQLADAQAQVDSGQAELATAASDLVTGKANLDSTAQQLADAKAKLDSSKAQLDASATQLQETDTQLAEGQAQLDAMKSQLDTAADQLATAKAQLDEHNNQLSQLASAIQTGRQQWYTAIQALEAQKQALIAQGIDPSTVADIQAAEAQLAATDQQLTALEAQYNQAQPAYVAGKTEYDQNEAAYQAGLTQYQASLETYNASKAQYDAGMVQYQAGLAQYNQGLAQYEAGLAQYNQGGAAYESGLADYQAGQAKLDQARSTIAQNQARLDEAIAKLDSSKADYATQKAEAEQKITDAKQNLEEAQADVEALEEPAYTSYTRTTFPGGDGYVTYKSGSESISAVGNLFPVVLYVVAAMVTFTTMTRFVDEERNNAGIFKALGYTNKQIIAKFVTYGFVASMAGMLVGILAGNWYLSPMIGNILTRRSVIGDSHTYFYPGWTLLAIVLGLLSAVLPAYLVAHRELVHEKPAQLLQAKPPVAGSKILLERLTFIWKRMSFTHKVTARNIFRYKQRMLMTIFGVAGSVALLFAGLGIQSSISGVADTQFRDIVSYDVIVVENSKASEAEKTALTAAISSDKVASSLAIRYDSLTETITGVAEEQSISLLVTDSDDLTNYIKLRDRKTGEALPLTDKGAILSEKLAKLYGVKVGDTVTMTIADKKVSVTVAGITEMYAGHYIYMTKAYYESLTGSDYTTNSYLVKLTDGSMKNIQNTAANFLEMDGVAGVVQNTAIEKKLTTVASSLQSVMIILIVLSILLGVVILYNLTNINVAERIRELSTIKVLGFHNKEVTMYIYRETIVLSIMGILTGLAGGYLLHKVLLNLIGSAFIMFQPTVAISVYIIPIVAIASILAVLGWLVNHTLRHVDMLEALKSVE
ncbi:FtsX-like permease family protein [Streptococcus caprae]|uniref:FtsX-like permease family protein n=1 Tax=Streptococcus caprae TaxID=1640501 RepID=A0ABV8CXI7_9STRE